MKEPDVTKELIEAHGLSEEEYEKIVEILGREPNYAELGIFSVMWSEHCSYKSSRVYLRTFPTTGERVLYGPGENSGVVDIGNGLAVAFKMESHNHPSYIEPYQGAATGVGGILRDIFTMGARPIASLNSLRFGSPQHPRTKYLVEKVVEGIAGYGNCMGVPTVGGEVYFNDCYSGNILVNVFNLGLTRTSRIFTGSAKGKGNPVIYVGSRTGRDGIHGATMASEEFDEKSEERRPTVQVGDPFMEKLLLEACLEAMKKRNIVGIQDMGAAGLTCSTLEMAARAEMGMEIDLSSVPRREEGMSPYEVMLSESQERMLLVAEKGQEEDVKKVFQKWDLDAVVIGRVTDDGALTVKDDGIIVAELPVKPLVGDAPVYNRPMRQPSYLKKVKELNLDSIALPEDYNGVLLTLLSSLNLCSKEWIYHQYDHMVRTNTIVLPGSDAAVVRIKGATKAVAMTVDCNSLYCYLDPYEGGKITVAESARNLVCSGARPVALTDCLNFGNPEKPEVMWQFRKVIEGMSEACKVFNTPVVSGNVSFYNETNGEGIYPTPTVGMIGLLEDYLCHTTQWFKEAGDLIVLLGENREELGGTEYLRIIHGIERGAPPMLDFEMEIAVQQTCLEAISKGIVKSAHDCSEGGFTLALAECCISGEEGTGADVTLDHDIRRDALLFGETQSRIILSVNAEDFSQLRGIAARNGAPLQLLGEVGGERMRINIRGGSFVIDLGVKEMRDKWANSLDNFMAGR